MMVNAGVCPECANLDLPAGIRGVASVRPVPTPEPLTGVYFMVKDDAIVYIGKSLDIQLRLLMHKGNDRDYDRVWYIPCDAADLDDLEKAAILTLLPPLNKSHKKQRGVAGWQQWAVDTLRRFGLAVVDHEGKPTIREG